jgi:hypothetical protein
MPRYLPDREVEHYLEQARQNFRDFRVRRNFRHLLAPTAAATTRRLAVLSAAHDWMTAQGFVSDADADESFWALKRESLLAAGATEADIDALAAFYIAMIAEAMAFDLDRCKEQIEAIVDHLVCCTEVDVRIRNNAVLSVIFPDRDRIH